MCLIRKPGHFAITRLSLAVKDSGEWQSMEGTMGQGDEFREPDEREHGLCGVRVGCNT
jgi:hypothetical protein